jgi:hypothetical protein
LHDIFGHADDRRTRHRVGQDAHAAADSVLPWPQCLGHPAAHHRSRRGVGIVRRVDRPAAQNPCSNRGEVVGPNGVAGELTQAVGRVDSGDEDRPTPGPPERGARNQAGMPHSGKRASPLHDGVMRRARITPRGSAAKYGRCDEHAREVIAFRNCLRRAEASDEQRGSNQQHHGERSLQHQEGGAKAHA